MFKKTISLIIAFCLILLTTTVFAANSVNDSLMDAGNTMKNAVGDVENVVEDTAGAVGTGIKDLGNTISNDASKLTNDSYSASRTSTTGTSVADNTTILGMSAGMWTWFVLAIAAILIVGLVWYYAMQNRTEYTDTTNN